MLNYNLVLIGASQVALVVSTHMPMQEARNMGSSPVLGRPLGRGHGNPFQYSFLENYVDRGTWQATVHRVTKSWTQLK